MKQMLWVLDACLLLAACAANDGGRHAFSLQGAWVMTQLANPSGSIYDYSAANETRLRLYEGDSMMYGCQLTRTAQALVVEPQEKSSVTLIDKGGGEWLYLEKDDLRPLTVVDDSTITIQRMGWVSTWRRADDIAREWGDDIRAIIDREVDSATASDYVHHYVLSAKEREQAGIIHGLLYAIIAFIVLVLVAVYVAMTYRRAKRRLQLQLQQIQEEHDARPQPVRQAIASVESAFFNSDDYLSLQRRMASGQRLRDEEWDDIEARLKSIYPGFTSQLRNLHPMSELEYQTCLLIKLRIMPKDIATVLSRDMSTISTVRSRLYKKVFGQKGGAREWDEFILSVGA